MSPVRARFTAHAIMQALGRILRAVWLLLCLLHKKREKRKVKNSENSKLGLEPVSLMIKKSRLI